MATVTETNGRDRISQDFRIMFAGKVDEGLLDKAAESLDGSLEVESAYPANGAIASILFWLRCRCNVDGGKTFTGDAFGLAVPGGSALFGDVYTDDLDRLYADTRNFTVVAAAAYTAFIFQDEQNNTLGTFHAGAVGTTVGTAYGTGRWE